MEKAKLSLRLATEKAVKENPGYQAVEITPELENGRPVATVTLIRGQEFKEVTQTLDLEETRADNKGNDFITAEESEWDPWEPFNEKTFWFNRQLDRYLLKPVATAYKAVLPDPVRKGLANALDNLDVTRRLVNNILQLRFDGAVREIARFVINSTVGMAGLFDVADKGFDIERSDRDTGQTLGKYGIAPGPYLVLPFLPPLTVRDLFGFVADEAMFPLDRFIPLGPAIGLHATEKISERAENIEEFAGVEETVVDLYGAVRNAYLQRRAADLRR
jgi:phospholipid-binding lipoprotein MlaA